MGMRIKHQEKYEKLMMRYTGLDGKIRKTFAVFHLVPPCFLEDKLILVSLLVD